MRFWIIQSGEPLPTDGPDVRVMRSGLLSAALRTRGHEVTWWAADFDHAKKRHRAGRTHEVRGPTGCRIVCVHSPGYQRNMSLGRLWDHRVHARAFRRLAEAEPVPDAILCSMPTIELAAEATHYGRAHGVPVAVDIRDLWPDVFVEALPRRLWPLGMMALAPYRQILRRALRRATAITGVTQEFVAWGLRGASRSAGALDRDFAMGYVDEPPDERLLHAARRRWDEAGLSGADPIACFFGTMGRQFDLTTVIEAARILQQQGAPLRLVLCGDGERRARYEAQAADCPNVHFPGWVGRAEISALMERAAVGLGPYVDTPNFRLNLPNKIIEYLSGGLPVLVGVAGAMGRLLDEHQCGMTYADARTLADQLKRLADDPEARSRMARNARDLYRQRFVAEAVYGRFADYLQELAAPARAAAP